MQTLWIAGWLAAGAVGVGGVGGVGPDTRADTTVELRRGDRVVVERLTGELSVTTWSRTSLSIGGDLDEVSGVGATRSGGVVTVRPEDRKARGRDVDLVLRLPAWVALEVSSRSLDVRVEGIEGGVTVRNVSGDIRVDRVAGPVSLTTVEGEIGVYGARGPVTAHSRGDDVTLVGVVGDVDVATGDGDLRLDDVTAFTLRAETLDGDVFFDGPLALDGTYQFSVHDGDATLVLPGDADASVTVSTFDGELTSDFPVTLRRYGGGGVFDFKLGEGRAQVAVKVFDGEIRFRRRGGS
jgi:DUF4097 and DUF4098 domain-containing protein YvlB